MSKLLKLPTKFAALLLSVTLLPGCGTSSLLGAKTECGQFSAPSYRGKSFAVQGRRTQDQQWISATQEVGITNCGWERPKE